MLEVYGKNTIVVLPKDFNCNTSLYAAKHMPQSEPLQSAQLTKYLLGLKETTENSTAGISLF